MYNLKFRVLSHSWVVGAVEQAVNDLCGVNYDPWTEELVLFYTESSYDIKRLGGVQGEDYEVIQ